MTRNVDPWCLRHGHAREGRESREYKSWCRAKSRRLNPNNHGYYLYGARGIMFCDRWRDSFANFLADMGLCPHGMSIERIDNNGNYEPGNCRWATSKEQSRNKRNLVWIEYKGERKIVSDWSRELRISASTIRERLRKGLPPEQVLWKARS